MFKPKIRFKNKLRRVIIFSYPLGYPQHIQLLLHRHNNITIHINTNRPDSKYFFFRAKADIVGPWLANSLVDDFISEHTAFLGTDEQQRVIMSEGKYWWAGRGFALVFEWDFVLVVDSEPVIDIEHIL